MTRAANALDSLSGAASALSGNVGGQEREQEAWTPDWILRAAEASFGGPIQLDPCGATAWELPEAWTVDRNGRRRLARAAISGGWFADLTLVKPGTHEGLKRSPHGGTVVCLDGKAQDWRQARSVFVNWPYDDTEAWLGKCAREGAAGARIIGLGPFRPHRRWFPELAKTCAATGGDLVSLWYSVRFKGHKDAFPAPLALFSWNVPIIPLGEKETARWAVK